MNFLIEYAMKFVGLPYLYGGSNALTGFDCSGLVQEILKMAGICPVVRLNSRQLYSTFKTAGQVGVFGPGALCFYGTSEEYIDHVAFMITDKLCIEAGHGDQTVINKEIAAKRGAVVHVRPYEKHGKFFQVIMPNYPDWLLKNG